jgi:hypothetical protein
MVIKISCPAHRQISSCSLPRSPSRAAVMAEFWCTGSLNQSWIRTLVVLLCRFCQQFPCYPLICLPRRWPSCCASSGKCSYALLQQVISEVDHCVSAIREQQQCWRIASAHHTVSVTGRRYSGGFGTSIDQFPILDNLQLPVIVVLSSTKS